MSGEFASVKTVTTGGARLIAVSDIHARGDNLELLLKKVGFSDTDMLFLLGDYFEKGPHSIDTLRYVMRLAQKENVFCLKGNCDTLWDDMKRGIFRRDLIGYMDWRGNSLPGDMCAEMGIDYHALGVDGTTKALDGEYGAVFAWLRGLPEIIDTERYTFVHAGLVNAPLSDQPRELCLKRDAFLEEGLCFDKTVVCGHMVVSNYAHLNGGLLSYNPFFSKEMNVIAIDGGESIKDSGQLNALILEDGRMKNVYCDDLEETTVTGEQEASRDFATIVWNHSEVEVTEKREQESLCYHPFSGRTILIPNEYIFSHDGCTRSNDYTTYRIGVKPGDAVSIAKYGKNTVLIKKNGVMGWVDNDLIEHN